MSDTERFQPCLDAFKLLNRRKTRWVVYKMGDDMRTPCVEKISGRKDTLKDFISFLPDTEPRYAVLDYEFITGDGRPSGKMYWIYWS